MHYGLQLLIYCTVTCGIQPKGSAAKTAVSPDVLATFAKNIASVLSPSLRSDFQTTYHNRSSANVNTTQKRSSDKEHGSNHSRRSRSTHKVEELNTNHSVDKADDNYRQENVLSNLQKNLNHRINNTRNLNTGDEIQESTRNMYRYRIPEFLYKNGLALAQLSNLDSYASLFGRQTPNLRRSFDLLANFIRPQNSKSRSEHLQQLEVEKNAPERKARLVPRSPVGAYNNYHGPPEFPSQPSLYGHQSFSSRAGPQSENVEETTDTPANTPNNASPKPQNSYGPHFPPYGPYQDNFYPHPGHNFPPYGPSDNSGNNSTSHLGYPGFKGYGFDPYYHQPHYPNFYPNRPYPNAQNAGPSDEVSPDNDKSNDTSTNHKFPYGPSFGYPYSPFDIHPFKPKVGFGLQGYASPFKNPFGHFPSIFLDSFKKGHHYPHFHHEPFPFSPHPPFPPFFQGFYPHHHSHRTNSVPANPTESVPSNDDPDGNSNPDAPVDLNGEAELISENRRNDVFREEDGLFYSNPFPGRELDHQQTRKRFVYFGSDSYKE